MAKRRNRQAESVETTVTETVNAEVPMPAETVETTEVVAAPPAEPETVSEVPATEPTPEAPAPAAETVTAAPAFWRCSDANFTPRRGFETVLWAALEDIGTEAEIINRLLASGEYRRVAPKAAELRPAKPTRFLLKTWVTAGVVARTAR